MRNRTKASCTSTTRAGRRCRAAPLKGRETCLAHADEITRGKTRFGGRQPGSGRPRKLQAPDAMRALLDECAEVVLRPFFRTLGYDVQVRADGTLGLVELQHGGAKLFGRTHDGRVVLSPYDDLKAMIAAAEKLLDRVYGRPKVQAEPYSPTGGVSRRDHGIDLKRLTDDELSTLEAICTRAGLVNPMPMQ